jgi:hypothetical protein
VIVLEVLLQQLLELASIHLSPVVGGLVIALVGVRLLVGGGDDEQAAPFQDTLYLLHYGFRTLGILDHFQGNRYVEMIRGIR